MIRCLLFWLAVLGTFLGAPALAAPALRVGVQLEPPHLDPTQGAAAAIPEVSFNTIYEGLVRIATDGTLHPLLATGWSVSPDAQHYVFTLRHGVRFHDGSRFDAAAVAFSLARAAAPGSLNIHAETWREIAAIRVLAPDRVAIDLSRPDANLPTLLALSDAAMVPPDAAETLRTHPVGTGPFRFGAWQRGDALTLERNADYWGTPAHLARITFRFIADPNAAYGAIRSGAIDIYPSFPAPETLNLLAADPRLKLVIGPSEGEVILAINQRQGPLANVLVRRAICHAIDRRALIDGAMAGYGTPIGSHFPPQSPDYVDLTGVCAHDPALARRLLAEAGYPKGLILTLKLPPPSYARRTGELIAAQLQSVGIATTIRNLEWPTWLDEVFQRHHFDLTVISHAEPFDYDIYARHDYYFGYHSDAFDGLIAALRTTTDPAARHRLLGDMQRQIAQDAPNAFLFQYPALGVQDRRLSGIWVNSPTQVLDYHAARFSGAGTDAAQGKSAAGAWAAWIAAALALGGLIMTGRRLGARWLGGRIAVLAVTLFATSVVIFVLLQIAPGDPAVTMLGIDASPRAIAALHAEFGLDASPLTRFVRWIVGALRGDFGTSFTYRVPVGALIGERLAVTLPLAGLAAMVAIGIGVPAGTLAARRPGGVLDHLVGAFARLGMAIPDFWLGVLLVLLLALGTGWFPAGGFPGIEAGFGPVLHALALPVLALAIPQAAILARVTRGALADVLGRDFIRAARAKGLSDSAVLWRHALPNAAAPVLAVIGLQVPYLIAGSALVEQVFSLPGLGRLAIQAIGQRDLVTVQAVVLLMATATVIASFAVDVAQALIDPRVVRQERA
ncbi:ABC transporter substrate-binding protein [Novosphingobium sp. Fuku2-ISO-50]|uniref:ABC transporter substrate-binding protein n=1 Tax=Novosphingobium sp. Fuku2-ISO-50 TaxID=1739114 RepID=UPI00076CF234|nr:ABC transporter substrate-binding protein [Novosphingobium sp. Fuku2-ISO-50]KUR79658.1 ABC transporter substrate-binding protein [Novosphingobium sp. Fuku2-ISO-50]